MKKSKRVLLHNHYLDVMGGGEKHILSICKVLEDNGYSIDVMWDKDLSSQIKNNLHIQLKTLRFVPKVLGHHDIVFKKLWFLKDYNILLYVTDGGYFFSSAKKNFIFSMYPKAELYRQTLLNKIKWWNFRFISNSDFTKKHLQQFGVQSRCIEPFIDGVFLENALNTKREKIILTVGRFFKQLHAKRQDLAIKAFQELQQKSSTFKDYKLVLVGNIKDEGDKKYLEELRENAKASSNIEFKPNASFKDLFELYTSAMYYWHFAGFGVDEQTEPEKVEHFGISPLEAMASGSIPLCYKAGGPAEVINDGDNGYLFKTNEELFSKMEEVEKNNELQEKLREQGRAFVQEHYSYNIFKKKVEQIILSRT